MRAPGQHQHCIPLIARLRFFNQLEDELQSHQHEEQWLRDKGQQLAQRDAELAGEVLREISLLETTWEDTKRLIIDRYERILKMIFHVTETENIAYTFLKIFSHTLKLLFYSQRTYLHVSFMFFSLFCGIVDCAIVYLLHLNWYW